MVNSIVDSTFLKINFSALLVTISFSPFISKDSLIIPKISLLFLFALYLIPKILIGFSVFKRFVQLKILVVIVILITVHYLLVFFTSSAPLEQQIYGRTGRGLGLLTHLSLLVFILGAAKYVKTDNIKLLSRFLVVSSLLSSIYSLFQSYGLDFLNWESKTNGVIGTLGNPNFQSAFAAIAIVPGFFAFWSSKFRWLYSIFCLLIFSWAIYRTHSTQGYILVFISTAVFIIFFSWYKSRKISIGVILVSSVIGAGGVLGMLNVGPLSKYLYKVSVQSRGDFWRSAFNTANDNPIFGVGIDSFGDWSLKYRDQIAADHSFAEYTDNAHNYFLEYAATGGYPLSFLYLVLTVFTGFCFFSTLRKLNNFDFGLTSLFVAWLCIQGQSVISPGNVGILVWNAILSGALIGYNVITSHGVASLNQSQDRLKTHRPFSLFLAVISLLVYYPLFNADRLQMKAMQTLNGDLAIKSAKMFPESVLRYTVITRALLESELPVPALLLAREAVKFNPGSANLWALIVINPAAPKTERELARKELLNLDPLNKEVLDYKILELPNSR